VTYGPLAFVSLLSSFCLSFVYESRARRPACAVCPATWTPRGAGVLESCASSVCLGGSLPPSPFQKRPHSHQPTSEPLPPLAPGSG